MTERMLRVANSAHYALSSPVTNIEEAVFYLGIRQVRQIAMSTPIIEDLQRLSRRNPFPWREFWQHCIATAILTREVISLVQPVQEEVEYVAGLLHDVGRIIMAVEFPEEFAAICGACQGSERDLREIEMEILGMDHCELGGIYLANHRLPGVIVQAARHSRLSACWANLRHQIEVWLARMHRGRKPFTRQTRAETVLNHQRLLKALSSGSEEKVAQMMRVHIEGWRRHLRAERDRSKERNAISG